ncbi:MAG: isoprenylcysteine carboxylmethyltransferase family protein [Gammaproteobacteria bacterium]|nr:isoprenylcysteine carboxylmethyltransferase family protein [Gammaproteobacteria bacterium]
MLSKLEHKIPPPIWGLLFAALMYLVADIMPILLFVNDSQWLIAGLFMAIGFFIDVYSVIGFVRAKTTINPLSLDASALVTSGLYKYSRNPMYLGMLLILLGWITYLGALSSLLLLYVFVYTINRLQIKPEEEKLEQLFGQQYTDYCQQARRWL